MNKCPASERINCFNLIFFNLWSKKEDFFLFVFVLHDIEKRRSITYNSPKKKKRKGRVKEEKKKEGKEKRERRK